MLNGVYIATNGVIMSFNVWPKLLLAAVIIMVVVGLFQYKANGKMRYNEKFFQFIAGILSAIVEFSMIVEMGQGIALELYSFVGAIIAFMIIGAMLIVVLWGIGEKVGNRRRACGR